MLHKLDTLDTLNSLNELDELDNYSGVIQQMVEELRVLAAQPECMARLHPVEVMMVHDVLTESRHLRCSGCRRWLSALINKAQGS